MKNILPIFLLCSMFYLFTSFMMNCAQSYNTEVDAAIDFYDGYIDGCDEDPTDELCYEEAEAIAFDQLEQAWDGYTSCLN